MLTAHQYHSPAHTDSYQQYTFPRSPGWQDHNTQKGITPPTHTHTIRGQSVRAARILLAHHSCCCCSAKASLEAHGSPTNKSTDPPHQSSTAHPPRKHAWHADWCWWVGGVCCLCHEGCAGHSELSLVAHTPQQHATSHTHARKASKHRTKMLFVILGTVLFWQGCSAKTAFRLHTVN